MTILEKVQAQARAWLKVNTGDTGYEYRKIIEAILTVPVPEVLPETCADCGCEEAWHGNNEGHDECGYCICPRFVPNPKVCDG